MNDQELSDKTQNDAQLDASQSLDHNDPTTDQLPAGYDAQKEALKPTQGETASDPVLASAVAWAQTEHLAGTMVSQVQKAVGAGTTGTYDEATADGVRNWQKAHGLTSDGRCGLGTAARMGIVFHREGQEGAVDKGTWDHIKASHGAGITVVGAVVYADQSANNREFINEANEMAPAYDAVSVKGGRISCGTWFPIKAVGDIVTAVNAIHTSLVSAWRAYDQPAADAPPPAYTQVKNLALLTHGITTALAVDAGGDYNKGLMGSKKKGGTSNLDSFVAAIKGAMASDMSVQLFACNAARDANTDEEYADWVSHGDVRGGTSFAQELADAFAKQGRDDASVFGHTTRGHLRRNSAARGFGKVARDSGMVDEGEKGGVQAVDLIFPPTVIEAEVTRIYGPIQGAARDKARAIVKQKAWDYYRNTWLEKDAAYDKSLDDEGVKGSGLGGLGFLDLPTARDVVVPHDFAQWVAKNQAAFASAGPLTEAAKSGTPRDGSLPLPEPKKDEIEPTPVVKGGGDDPKEDDPKKDEPEPTPDEVKTIERKVTPDIVKESRGDVVVAAEKIAAKHPTYGSGRGQYVCTTYCEQVLRDAGYTVDKATSARINVHVTDAQKTQLPSLIEHDDPAIKGIVTALVDSKQGLEVPVDPAAPAANLAPGDFVQYWRKSGGGHCVMVHSVVDQKTIVMLSSHESSGGVGDRHINLTSSDLVRVYAVRPMGSPDFASLVALRQTMKLPVAPFDDAGRKTTDPKQEEPRVEPKTDPKVEPKKDPKVEPKKDPTPVATKTQAERERELAGKNATAIDASHGVSAEERDKKAAWDADIKAFRGTLKGDAAERDKKRQAPLDALDAQSRTSDAERETADEAAVRADYLAPLDDKKLVIGREKKKKKLEERLQHVGLLGADHEAVTLSPQDRELVLMRVDSLANQLYFAGGDESIDEAGLDGMAVDLAQRMLSGRLVQRFLGDLAEYWSHFSRDKMSKADERSLKESDPAAFEDYKKDRDLTRERERKHSKTAELGRDMKEAFGGKAKDPGASPGAIESLVAAGQQGGPALEPWIASQAARAPSEADPFIGGTAVGKRVDEIQDRPALDGALATPLARLGLTNLPVSPVGAPEVVREKGANEVVKAESFTAAEEAAPDQQADAFLTIVYKQLAALVLGVHAKPSHDSARLDDVRPGDRVPVTPKRETAGGHVWAQALVQPPSAEVPGGARLGWLDTAFTNESRASGEDPKASQKSLLGEVPRGLRVIDYLRPTKVGAPIPVYAGVYDDDRKNPIAFVGVTPLELIQQTADNDPDLVEVLVGGRPGYVERAAVRTAERAERLVQLPTLSADEIQEVRHWATCQADPATRAAVMERLQAQAMYVAESEGTVPDGSRRGPLAALGMALESLGLVNPYPTAKSFGDALEMVRLERGLSPDLTGAGLATLVVPFGASAARVEASALQQVMAEGRAVLIVQGAQVLRLAERRTEGEATRWFADDPAKGRVPVDVAAGELWALSVPASYDDGSGTRADAGLRDASTVTDAYKKNVYAATDAKTQAWYLSGSTEAHGKEVTDALKSWLPTGGEAATMPAAAQKKAFGDWMAKHAAKGLLDGLATVKSGFVDPLEAAGGDVASMRGVLALRARKIVGPLLEREPSAAAHEQALALIGRCEALGLLSPQEIAGLRADAERLRPSPDPKGPGDDDFKALFERDRQQIQGGLKGKGTVDLTPLAAGKTLRVVRYEPDKPTYTQGQRVVVQVNDMQLTYKYTAMKPVKQKDGSYKTDNNTFLYGWVLDGVDLAGRNPGHDHDALLARAAGLSEDEAQIYAAKNQTEGGTFGHMTTNAYDRVVMTFGGHGLAGVDYGYGSSKTAEVIARVTSRPDGKDLDAFLASAGIVVKYETKADKKRSSGGSTIKAWFEASTPDGKSYSEHEVGTRQAVMDIMKAYDRDLFAEQERALKAEGKSDYAALAKQNLEKMLFDGAKNQVPVIGKNGYSNLPQLIIRLDPLKLATMTAVMSDPRVQMVTQLESIDEMRSYDRDKVAGGTHTAWDYLWSPLSRYAYDYTSDHIKSKKVVFAETMAALKSTYPQLDDPTTWTQAIEDEFRTAYASRAMKANQRTLATVMKDNGIADRLSSTRPGKKPASSTAPVDIDAALDNLAVLRAQRGDQKQDDRKKESPAPAPLDLSRYVALGKDAQRKARLDAVYASAAGGRNLDAALVAPLARLAAAKSPQLEVARGFPSWTERALAYLTIAVQAQDREAAAAIAKAIDIAEQVAAKYPDLGKQGPGPKIDPVPNTGGGGGGGGKTDPMVDPKGTGGGGHGAHLETANAYYQGTWYGADGKALSASQIKAVYDAVEEVAPGVLVVRSDNSIRADGSKGGKGYGDLSFAIDNFLQLSPAERQQIPEIPGRPGQIYLDPGKKHAVKRTDALLTCPAIKFFPGSKSCQRAARASLRDYGLEIDAGGVMTLASFDAEAETGKKTKGGDVATRISRVRMDQLDKAYTFLETEITKHPVPIAINYKKTDMTNTDGITDHFMTAIDMTAAGIGYVDPGASSGGKRHLVKQPVEIEVLEGKDDKVPDKKAIPMWIDPTYKDTGAQLTQVFPSKVVDPNLLAKTTGGSTTTTTGTATKSTANGGGGTTTSGGNTKGTTSATTTKSTTSTTTVGGTGTKSTTQGGNSVFGGAGWNNWLAPITNNPSLDALMKKERLTPEEIRVARDAIEKLPASQQGPLFLELQAKNAYKSQRDNTSSSRMSGEKTATINNMCNLTSLAMCFEQLGYSNPGTLDGHTYGQFEDYLEALRIKNKLGARTVNTTFEKLGRAMTPSISAAWLEEFEGKKVKRDVWQQHVGAALASGRAVMMSIVGHIVRVQGVTSEGLVIDDPYGVVDLNVPTYEDGEKVHSWSYKKSNRNDAYASETTTAGKKGEDNLWTWAEVEKHTMNWVMTFKGG